MKNLYLLVKIGIQEQFKLAELKNHKNKSRRRNTILLLIAFLFLGIVIMGYAAGSAYGLVYMKMENQIGPVALTAATLFTLLFTMLKTNGILFGYHSYDILASLPVKAKTLVASRFMQLYLPNLLISLLVMLPMGMVYGIFCKQEVLFYILWILSIPAAPLIPTTIAALLGVLIMAVSSRMRHPQAVSALLLILVLAGIFAGTGFISNTAEQIQLSNLDELKVQEMIVAVEKIVFTLYPVSRIFQQAISNDFPGALLYFLLFVIGSYAWYFLFVKLTGHFYSRLQSALTSHGIKRSFKKWDKTGIYTQRTPLTAVYQKEWKRFLSSNIYLTNMGCGVIMIILISIGLAVLPQDKLMELLQSNGTPITFSLQDFISSFAPFVVAGVLSMSCSSCCSLSLEGKNIEMVKSLPINPTTLYKGKILMNLTLLVPVSLICSLALALRYGTNALQIILLFVIPLIFACFTSVWGMFANIHFPNYSWENEVTVVKQSAASFFGIFGGLLLAIICGILIAILPKESQLITTILVALLVLAFCGMLYRSVMKSVIPSEK